MWGSSDAYYNQSDTRDSDFLEDVLSPSFNLDGMEDTLEGADDCFLSEECLQEILTPPPSQDKWKDFYSTDNPSLITIDASKDYQWKLAKQEVEHVRANVIDELGVDEFKDVTIELILMHCLGPESPTGLFFRDSLDINKKTYLQFMGTVFYQAAYKVSSTQLFNRKSKLKECTLMTFAEYKSIWEAMSKLRKLQPNQISTSRRKNPLWETQERILNELMRSISISGRRGKIAIALDDDKIWLSASNSSSVDLFNLKYTTHVQANRKGIIAHTALSTGVSIPLGIVMERSKDTTAQCFQRLLDFLFSQDGSTNLANVAVHSDRGYMIPSLAFDFLLANGGDLVGTVKRMAQCWPFTYKQTLKPSDQRTVIDTKGAPTLFLKYYKTPTKYVFASAFRNGSETVATAVSTMHSQHQWEGVALKPRELRQWQKDKTSLKSSFFQRVKDLVTINGVIDNETIDEEELMEELLERIEPYTLRQGEIFVPVIPAFAFLFI